MKTTFDLPDVLYRRIKIRAVELGTSVREIVIESLQRELDSPPAEVREAPVDAESAFAMDELGWPVLKRPAAGRVAVTEQIINDLREREGI